ncbi:MAG: hypothetical protein KJ896_00335, partial [Nanoarchaeota archaeon]|nr:hypothetical protein [Nanoarchaeota archaeon]
MKKRKFDKNLILTFLIGVLITIIIIKLVVPSIMEYKIETEFLDKVENAPIPLPYYSFASYHMKSFIALILPDKESYITENVVSNVRSKINEIYQPQFEVAINGISSDQETVDYMEKSGLLTELSLSGEEAL